jgi:hypothetical protein
MDSGLRQNDSKNIKTYFSSGDHKITSKLSLPCLSHIERGDGSNNEIKVLSPRTPQNYPYDWV